LLSISTTLSMRGKWKGSAPRLARRLRTASARSVGEAASTSAAVSASLCSTVSEQLDVLPAQFRDVVVQARPPARLIDGGLPSEAAVRL
jgi:hypothetical protein